MKRFLFTISLAAAALGASAVSLNIAPGDLCAEINRLKNTQDTELVLSGSANVTDLALLKYISSSIKTLDMSGLTIEAYSYVDGNYMGRKSFSAGEIPPYMLFGTHVSTVRLPLEVNSIGESAFALTQIRDVNMPTTVRSIANYAYAGCQLLKVVTIPAEVTLGNGVFRNCSSLSDVSLEYNPTVIPEGTFEGCAALNYLIPASVTSIGARAFYGTAMKEANLYNVRSVGDFAFADCPDLTEIVLNNNLETAMGNGVFFNDPKVVTALDWTGEIPALFAANSDGVSHTGIINSPIIGEGAFANNTTLDSITFGPKVVAIEAHAFRNATKLQSINALELADAVPEVDNDAFSGLENNECKYPINLYVKNDAYSAWNSHPVWSKFDIEISTAVEDLVADAGEGISARRHGDTLSVSANLPIREVRVYTVGGVELASVAPEALETEITGLPTDEVLVVRIVAGDVIKALMLK